MALRDQGFSSLSFCLPHGQYAYKTDVHYRSPRKPRSIAANLINLIPLLFRAKIFHFYFGCTYFGYVGIDQLLLKLLGKKIVHHFCGCDIRDYLLESTINPFGACAHCAGAKCSPHRRKALMNAARYADVVFVSTPDLLVSFTGAIYLPQAVDVDGIRHSMVNRRVNISSRDSGSLRIAHAPTDRAIKGTQYLLDTVEALQLQGFDISLLLLENMSNSDLMAQVSSVDLVVDQLLIGSYGTFAVEVMSMAIPVLCYLRSDSLSVYPEIPPIINASPESLERVLRSILADTSMLAAIGESGYQYASKYHSYSSVATRLSQYYLEL